MGACEEGKSAADRCEIIAKPSNEQHDFRFAVYLKGAPFVDRQRLHRLHVELDGMMRDAAVS